MFSINRLMRATVVAMLAASGIAAPVGAGSGKVVVGQPAPDFTVTLIKGGGKLTLADLRGQVVVLNYWATWCVPCRKELPVLDTYYKIQKMHGMRVFAVTTEDSLPDSQLKKLFAVMHLDPVRNIKGPYTLIGNALPTNIVIGRDGRVRYAQAGMFTLDKLNEVIVPLLNEPMPPPLPAPAP